MTNEVAAAPAQVDDSGRGYPNLAPSAALSIGFVVETAIPEPQPVAVTAAVAVAATSLAAAEWSGVQAREGFRVGGLNLMIRYEDGNELTELPTIHQLPNAPPWFLGMTNLHGMLTCVFDPAPLFGNPVPLNSPVAKAMLLVLGHGDDKAALVIDGLPLRLRPSASQRQQQAPVPTALKDCVSDVYLIDGEHWFDFKFAALFDRLEGELAA